MIAISRDSPSPPWRIDITAQVAQRCEPAPPSLPLRYQLVAELQLGNPNGFEVEFDALVIGFRRLTGSPSRYDPVAQRISCPSDAKIVSDYLYDGTVEQAIALSGEPELERQLLHIPGNKAMTLPSVPLGPQHAVEQAPGEVLVTLYMLRDGVPIAPPLAGTLPSRSAVPVLDPWGKSVKRVRVSFASVRG